MSRKRNKENTGLPLRWKLQHGAYYYRVPPGLEARWDGKKMFRLGKTLPEAHRVWADRIATPDAIRTINQLFDRYLVEVVPAKALKTQADNLRYIERLRPVFGHLAPQDVTPQMVYQYHDRRKAPTAARLEMSLLSHALTKAVEWGIITRHPFKGEIEIERGQPRTRYVEDWEIVEILTLEPRRDGNEATPMVQAYLRLKLLIGLRQIDMLELLVASAKDDGLHVTPKKTQFTTGKKIIIGWSDELRAAWSAALAVRPVHISPWVFCTKRGQKYSSSGFQSIWQRYMDRALTETQLKERFTEHDLRAKVGSDAGSLEHARRLLAHADSKITQRVYRRKPEVVPPLR